MNYLARFERIEGHFFRFDTRIYIGQYNDEFPSKCVGAIVGKNPGSAKPNELGTLGPLNLDGDKMLPYVRNRFISAYKSSGKEPCDNSFVRVWNLFYLCNENLDEAKEVFSNLTTPPYCQMENEILPFVWFGWGGYDGFLNPFKVRFQKREYSLPFFYDNKQKKMIPEVPKIERTAKHTQGLPKEPIENYLTKLL